MKNEKIKQIINLIIAVLTAIASSLFVASCCNQREAHSTDAAAANTCLTTRESPTPDIKILIPNSSFLRSGGFAIRRSSFLIENNS